MAGASDKSDGGQRRREGDSSTMPILGEIRKRGIGASPGIAIGRAYVVDRVLPKVPWDAVKYLRPTETEQLTLQTSTSYHPTSPRFIVIAHPAP